MGIIVGIDEAGRGPIIGPMVMAAVAVPSHSNVPKGLKDSKLLTPARREQLYEKIVKLPHAVRVIPPAEVDEWVFRGELNWLEAKYTVEMLIELGATEAIVDCPSRNLALYRQYLESRTPGCVVRTMFKADQKYKVVSAASIIAKVTRDRLVQGIKAGCGRDCGSGYLTDPLTQAFMQEFDPQFPHYRRSWQPYKDRLAALEQRTLL